MKLVVLLAGATLFSTAASAEWYAVRNGDDGCSTALTPGAMLRLADATGRPASSYETKDAAGNVVAVTVSMDQGSSTITAKFYATEEACLASIPPPRAIPKSYD